MGGAISQPHLRRAPLISVVKATDFGDRDDRRGGCSGQRSVIGRIFLEPEVRSGAMVTPDVGSQDAPEMRLVDDDHVIETFASDRSDQAFDVRILPRTRRRGDDFTDADASQSALEDVAVDAVSISMQPAGHRVLRKRVDHLLSAPDRRGMIRDIHMHNAPALVRQEDEDEQHSAGKRWDREEIYGRRRGEVIGEERAPRLRRRTGKLLQQTGHRAFGDVDTECAQLAMNPRGSPQGFAVAIFWTRARI